MSCSVHTASDFIKGAAAQGMTGLVPDLEELSTFEPSTGGPR